MKMIEREGPPKKIQTVDEKEDGKEKDEREEKKGGWILESIKKGEGEIFGSRHLHQKMSTLKLVWKT